MSTTNSPNMHTRLPSSTSEDPAVVRSELQDLDALVDAFAAAMKAKLHQKHTEGFRGWNRSWFSPEEIQQQLRDHIPKGDPVDIANYAAFWWGKTSGLIKGGK